MLLSTDSFIEMHNNKSYSKLLKVRDELLAEILEFEQTGGLPRTAKDLKAPSREVKYLYNLEYLGALCKLMAEKYKRQRKSQL